YPLYNLRGQIERLHATAGLPQELKRQPDAKPACDVREFPEHPARFDYTVFACCSRRQQARHDDYVRTIDLRGKPAYFFTFAEQFQMPTRVSKGYSLDRVDAVRRY